MSMLTRFEILVRRYASIPVAILCFMFLMLFVSLDFRSVLGPVLGGTIGAFAAIIILHVRRPAQTETTWICMDYRIAGIVTSLYVVTVFTIYRFVLHQQPLIHYLAFGGFAGYIAYEIATGAGRRRVVPQLLVLTFFTYWSVQLAFPAGMNEPDTRGKYLPAIEDALANGTIKGFEIYLGHLVYITEGVLITGLSPQTGYFLIATLVLAATVLTISTLNLAFPSISRPVALYAALFFGCMSWTLGRGFHPTKLSLFYGLTLLLAMAVVVQYVGSCREWRIRWTIIGAVVGPALIFGHQFSAGAALVFLVAIVVFALLASVLPTGEYTHLYPLPAIALTTAYGIAIGGHPFHADPLTGRFASIVMSIFFPTASGGSGGGPGRYSELSIELLLISTSGDAILFGFGILGAAIAIRHVDWEYDLVIVWMGFIAVFLGVSLVFNAADTQPQRFYSLLGLFGLNIFGGVTLVYLVRSDITWFTPRTVAVVIFVFAVMSLASPVASVHISMVSDDVPHNRLHDTNSLSAGEEWVDTYEGDNESMLRTMPPHTDLPYELDSGFTAFVNTSQIEPGERYVYTDVASETGVRTGGGLGLGDRTYVFLEFDSTPDDNLIHSNGEVTVYERRGI